MAIIYIFASTLVDQTFFTLKTWQHGYQGAIDVITAAAKIIKSDIREIPVDKSSLEDLNDTDYEKMGTRELANIS